LKEEGINRFLSFKMERDLPVFRPFTREELEIIEGKIFDKKLQEKKKAEKRAKNVAVSRFCKFKFTQVNLHRIVVEI
jgi:hypothetical protein